MSAESTALLILPAEAGNSLLAAAQMEFQATLQLLADHACWVTDARSGEIALEDKGELLYAAVSEASEHEPGSKVAGEERQFAERMAQQRAFLYRTKSDGAFSVVAPVTQDGKALGFITLTSHSEITEESEKALAGIAELISVAVQHRDAAARAERLEFRDDELELPSHWVAPESAEPPSRVAESQKIATKPAAEVRTCTACGFPVSPGRRLCVECELKPEAAAVPNNLFQAEAEESWMSAHGYLLASLVVTALTAAVLLWLRH